MDITKGDYARFNSSTYLEVYEDIQEKAQKKYRDEAVAHGQTQEKLKNLEKNSSDEIEDLKARISTMEENEKRRQESFHMGMGCHTYTRRYSISFVGGWHRDSKNSIR